MLVIGAGQSGCQVCEDLLRAGRAVYLAVGRCRTLPRRYRGRDVITWQHELGSLDRRATDLADPALRFSPGDPQMTGRDGGSTVRLADLAARGARLLGRLEGSYQLVVHLDASVPQQAVAWVQAAVYLTGRIQSTPENFPEPTHSLHLGRAPDLSPEAAAAMRAVLAEVGFSAAEIAELTAAGVVAHEPPERSGGARLAR